MELSNEILGVFGSLNLRDTISGASRQTLSVGNDLILKLPDMVRKKAMPCLWFVQVQFSLFLEIPCSQYLKIF